jgi:hypothetical protein
VQENDKSLIEGKSMKRNAGAANRGIALMIVLIIILFLVIFTTAFSKTMVSSYKTQKDNEYSAIAFYVADSGLQYGFARLATGNANKIELLSPTGGVIHKGDLPQYPDLFGEVKVTIDPDTVTTSPSTHTVTAQAEIKRSRGGSLGDEVLARRILVAVAVYDLEILNPRRHVVRGNVNIQSWYEKNR